MEAVLVCFKTLNLSLRGEEGSYLGYAVFGLRCEPGISGIWSRTNHSTATFDISEMYFQWCDSLCSDRRLSAMHGNQRQWHAAR